MGTALLILAEILIWGLVLLAVGAACEVAWARIRRKRRDTLVN